VYGVSILDWLKCVLVKEFSACLCNTSIRSVTYFSFTHPIFWYVYTTDRHAFSLLKLKETFSNLDIFLYFPKNLYLVTGYLILFYLICDETINCKQNKYFARNMAVGDSDTWTLYCRFGPDLWF
jgi:hypothetical protein